LEKINFNLNGKEVEAFADPGETLLDLLNTRLNIQSVKRGCDEGQCGACTVLLDGNPVLSCLLPFEKANGRNIITLEGLKDDMLMKQLEEEFVKQGAVQCGYCTTGFLITLYAYFKQHKDELNEENLKKKVAEALVNNICRCGSYKEIEKAAVTVFKLELKK